MGLVEVPSSSLVAELLALIVALAVVFLLIVSRTRTKAQDPECGGF